MKIKLPIETSAEFLEMTVSQVEELRHRLSILNSDDIGFESLHIDIKRYQVYRMSHLVEGKLTTFQDDKKDLSIRLFSNSSNLNWVSKNDTPISSVKFFMIIQVVNLSRFDFKVK